MALLVFNLTRLPSPFDYVNESVFEIPSGRAMRMANRKIRLIFILGGEARMRLGTQLPVTLRAGDVVIFPKPTSYTYLPVVPGQSTRLQALAVSIKDENRSVSISGLIKARFPEAGHHPGIQNAAMLHSIHQIRTEAESGRKDTPIAVGALANLLVLALVRGQEMTPAASAQPRRSSRYLIEQAREYIFKNHAETLTLKDIAWHLRLSEEYLARLFKRETGQTVFGYVRELRLNAAKRMLAGTNLSISQIAEAVGFSVSSIFCRAFRQAFGLSPGGYREAHAGNPNADLRAAGSSI